MAGLVPYVETQVPYTENKWTNCYTYENWEGITAPGSKQLQLIVEAGGRKYNGNGYGQIEGRYVIACAENVGTTGDYIDVMTANGTLLHCIVGDVKNPTDTNPPYNPWGHLYGGGSYICVIEFITNWPSGHTNPGNDGEWAEIKGNLQWVKWVGNWWGNKPGDPSGGTEPSPERPSAIKILFDAFKTLAKIDTLAIVSGVKIIGGYKSPVQYFGSVNGDGLIYFNDDDFYRCGEDQPLQIYNQSSQQWVYSGKVFNITISMISASSLVTSTGNGLNYSPPTIVVPENNGFVPGGTADPVGRGVEAAIQWALNIAGDDTHLYSQDVRWGPSYDCSSLMYSAFQRGGGFDLPLDGDRYTGSMRRHFTACGFKWLTDIEISSESLRRGDILLWHRGGNGHTVLYIGNGQVVGARSSKLPKADQISVHNLYTDSWQGVLRYAG